jgi:ABC-2 type transport system ATP-binding protein
VPAVEIRDLVVRHGEVTAVDGVGFAVHPGETVALLGVNGAGKTTTVETLLGFNAPAGGRVSVLGLDPLRDRHAIAGRTGVMLQGGGLNPAARPHELVRLQADLLGVRVDGDELDRVALTERRRTPVRRLSGGERQRLALTLALMGEPAVLLLDEPTAGVDVDGRGVVRRLLAEHRERGAAILVTTHELPEAELSADRVVVIHQGRVVADGSIADLRRQGPAADIRFRAPSGLDVVALSDAIGVHVAELGRGEYSAPLAPTADNISLLTGWLARSGIGLEDLRAGQPGLEEIFLELTRRDGRE